MNNNIIIISDVVNILETLVSKVVLLRKNDKIIPIDYKKAVPVIEANRPIAVFIHENVARDITLGLVEQIKTINPDIAVILLTEENNQEFILAAYDKGVDDFCSVNAESYELVIRVVKSIKFSSQKIVHLRDKKLLMQNLITDELTGLYNYKFVNDLFEEQLRKTVGESGIFMAVAPSEESKRNFSIEKFAFAVKKSIRYDDIVAMGRGAKFYLMLPKSDVEGACHVLENINKNYGLEFSIKAGMYKYSEEDFKQIEKMALAALSEAMFSASAYKVSEPIKKGTLDEWLEGDDANGKDFKLFRSAFNKKMEKIIAPVFYRLQETYEGKLFNTQIQQYVNENECVFHLKNSNQDSKLKIVYPGFSKIVVYIIHEGFDSPENKELTLPLSKVTQNELVKIVEDFIKEFRLTSA